MLKKTFIRLIVMGILSFACFFLLIALNRAEKTAYQHSVETDANNDNLHSRGEFILESFIGSVLAGTH
jgi:hypothetical protein